MTQRARARDLHPHETCFLVLSSCWQVLSSCTLICTGMDCPSNLYVTIESNYFVEWYRYVRFALFGNPSHSGTHTYGYKKRVYTYIYCSREPLLLLFSLLNISMNKKVVTKRLKENKSNKCWI